MAFKLTIRYDNKTNWVVQTYSGESPNWESENGSTITTVEVDRGFRNRLYDTALENVSESDYNADIEEPVPHLIYNENTESLEAKVEIKPLPES